MSAKLKGIFICTFIYLLALAGAAVVVALLPEGRFQQVLIADVVATVIVFTGSVLTRNASMYDPYWSVAPVAMAAYWIHTGVGWTLMNILVMLAIAVWAVRLTVNWVKGWEGITHEDWRYVKLRTENPSTYLLINFTGIHMFPTAMVFLGMLPVYFIVSQPVESSIFIYSGTLICFIATAIEYLADEQMRTFRKTAAKGTFIQDGLWKYSRHPNYFGEILFWFGLWVMVLGSPSSAWWTAIGFVAMIGLFSFISIPMMEKRVLATRPGYQSVIDSTSMLIPFWKK